MKLAHLVEVLGFSMLIYWSYSSRIEYFSDDTQLAYDMMNCCGGGSRLSYHDGTENMVLTVYNNMMACRKCYEIYFW